MEQLVLYVAVLAALSGFGMGLMNLAGPYLKRRDFQLPSISIATLLRRGGTAADDDEDLDLDDEDVRSARELAETSFIAAEATLLARRNSAGEAEDEEELDEELVSVLEEVAEEDIAAPVEDEEFEEDEGPVIYTVSAEVNDAAEDDAAFDPEAVAGDALEGDEDAEDEEEYEDEEEEAKPEVQVVAAGGGGGDDMMSFFDEAADAGAAAVAAWRQDVPDVTIEELLADARAISQQIKGKRNVA